MHGYPQIYMPFKSLKGYDDYIASKEKVIIEDKELLQDRLDELNYLIRRITVGNIITVIYKDKNSYIKKTGKVSLINIDLKKLCIVKTCIPISSVISIEIEGEN